MTTTDSSDLKERIAARATGAELERVDEAMSPAKFIREAIERQSSAFHAVLPSSVDPERFSRLVLTAVKATPQLMECFTTEQGQVSLLLSAMQAAAVGLEPNTPTQECWLTPRRNRQVMECQLSIGYRGYMKLARRSGTVKAFDAQVVHANDEFDYGYDAEGPYIRWKPAIDEPGDLVYAFAKVWFHGGGSAQRVLTRRQVEARRAMSDSWKSDQKNNTSYSPWSKWTEEMWLKTAIRALVPFMDLSPEAERTVASDERTLRYDDDAGIINAVGELDAGEVSEKLEPDEVPPEEIENAKKACHAETGKAFPLPKPSTKADREEQEAKRHAVIRNVTAGRTNSLNDCDLAEIGTVRQWLHDVIEGRVVMVADDSTEEGWRCELASRAS